MLQMISHIVRISARRDRTEINQALVDVLVDMFHPQSLTIYRTFSSETRTMVFACAGIDNAGAYARNAYLPEAEYCRPIAFDPQLHRSQTENMVLLEALPNGSRRLVFPIAPMNRLLYLIDITIEENLAPKLRQILMAMIEYFSNHIALLDYGETDTLTGLPNRKTFDKHLFELLDRAVDDEQHPLDVADAPHRRRGSRAGRHWLAVFDIDHFKAVNDTHGHLIGDEVLVMFARLMRNAFRYHDQLFRFGGEEFVAVLQPTSEAFVHRAFERFRKTVASHGFSRVGHITVSIGYSQLLGNDTPPDVIDRADEALYYVKEHGRNSVSCYENLVASRKLISKTTHTGAIELF